MRWIVLVLVSTLVVLVRGTPSTAAAPASPTGDCLGAHAPASYSEWHYTAANGPPGTLSILRRDVDGGSSNSFIIKNLLGKTFTGTVNRKAGDAPFLVGNSGTSGSDPHFVANLNSDSKTYVLTGWVDQSGGHTTFSAALSSCRWASKAVVVVQGIDSASSCANDGHFKTLRQQLDDGGVSAKLYAFSYSGSFRDCRSGRPARSGGSIGATDGTGVAAQYSAGDTCIGVAPAAALLSAQLESISASQPDAVIILVGHSLGGLVVTYGDAAVFSSETRTRVSRMVLLDSPVKGIWLRGPISACFGSQSSADLGVDSAVVRTINDRQYGLEPDAITSVLASSIGSVFPGSYAVTAACYSDGALLGLAFSVLAGFFGPFWALVGGVGGWAWETSGAHSCVWSDPVALDTIAGAVRAA